MLQEGHSNSFRVRLDKLLFNNEFNVTALEIFTKIYVLFTLFVLGSGDLFGSSFRLFANIPDFFFNPPLSIVSFLDGFPDYTIALTLDVIFHLLFGLVFISIRPSLNLFLIFLLQYTCSAFGYSFGKIDHNILSLLLPFILGVGHCIKNRSPQFVGFIYPVYAFLVGFAFFTASLPKIFSGEWLNIWTHSVKGFVFQYAIFSNPLSYIVNLNAPLLEIHGIFWEALDYLVVMFEFFIVFSVFRPKHFKYFLFFACLFHFGTYIFLNIGFFHHFLVYLFFIPWHNSDKVGRLVQSLGNLDMYWKVVLVLLFIGLAFFPNSLFFALKEVLFAPYDKVLLALFSLFFVVVFFLNVKDDFFKDLKSVFFEIRQLWFG